MKPILRILLSPVLVVICMLFIPNVNKALVYLPLIFALSVSLVNYSQLKINKIFGVFLSVAQSYAVFIGLALTAYIFDDIIGDLTGSESQIYEFSGIVLVTVGGYLAAMLLFYFSTFIYSLERRRLGYISISVVYILVILVMQIFSKYEFLQFGVEKFASFLISWVIFMSLAYSFALNKNHLDLKK